MAKRKATPQQLENLTKARAVKRAKQRSAKRLNKKFGLTGFGNGFKNAKPNLMDAFKAGGLTLIGVVAGRELEKKVFKSDEKEGFMQYLADILKVGGGVAAATQDNVFLKYIGAGVALEGAISAGGRAMGKDLLGEGLLNGLQGYYDEKISGTLSKAKSYDELPPLPGDEDDQEDYHESDYLEAEEIDYEDMDDAPGVS